MILPDEECLLQVSFRKSNWTKDSILVLGHRMSAARIEPNPHRVLVVRRMPPPTKITDVKSFMDMVGLYQRFIPGLSTVGEPLFHLCHNKVPFF